MSNLGERMLLFRVLGAGLVLLLLLFALLLPPARGQAALLPADALFVRIDDADLIYHWSLPAEAALAPALVRDLRAETDRSVAAQRAESRDAMADALGGNYPARPYEYKARWVLGALSDTLLAMHAAPYLDTGGAHGNVAAAALLFDRAAGKRIALADLFSDWKTAEPLLRAKVCASLEAQRGERRGPDRKPSGLADFDSCPALADLAIWPSGEDSRPWGLRWAAGPYVAGPWSEGSYGDFLSVEPDLAALIKPAYRESFLLPARFR